MTRFRSRHAVEKDARTLLDELGVTKPPVDVEHIARKLGYRVVFEHFPGDLSGTLIRDTDGTMTIGINSFHAPTRQRFSIGHEIGHAQLHAGAKGQDVLFVDPPGTEVLFRDDRASLGEDPKEIQANQFAAALLMPSDYIQAIGRKIVEKSPSIGVDAVVTRLALRFSVSEQAMRYRLVTLGMLEPD
jgi:Zn-dependent peptidase ImmA (M78 family)